MNASGLNGTNFVSDVTLTNPGAVPAAVTVVVRSLLGLEPEVALARPGPDRRLPQRRGRVLSRLSGARARSRSTRISRSSSAPGRTTRPPRARTASRSRSSRTTGFSRRGTLADSLWISQDASGSSGYRTNVAVVFPDATGGAATVTVFDADGIERGRQDFSPRRRRASSSSPSGASRARSSVGRAQVVVTRGRAAGYAVVVDNVTGDSSLFAFEDLPAGIQDVLVNGVARANGRNGTFFRTDGRFYNPTDDGRDGPGRVPRKREREPVARVRDVRPARRKDPRRRRRPRLAARPPRRLRRRAALQVGLARRDPLPHEQRGPARASSPARSARSRSPCRSCRS